jgi:hypothetical protein
VGKYTSLGLDSKGFAHISYYDDNEADLEYAYQDATGWHLQTLDTWGGEFTSLKIDSNDYVHISYYDNLNYDLKYAYEDETGWHIQIIESDGNVGEYTSLAIDGDGYSYISYFYPDNWEVKYAYQDVTGWHLSVVDTQGYAGYFTSLALDRDGYPHISYSGNDELRYAYQDATGWHKETVDNSPGTLGWHTSLALDGNDQALIGYYDYFGYDLKVAFVNLPDMAAGLNHLPLVLGDIYFYGPWEAEPNNVLANAIGPLRSNQDYFGYHNDDSDYFKIITSTAGQISVNATSNHTVKDSQGNYVIQLQLRDQDGNLLDYKSSPSMQIIYYAPAAGWYYIRIYTNPAYLDASKTYTLRVVYP